MTIEPDRLWDAWRDARRERPGLALEEFAQCRDLDLEAVRAALLPLLALERSSPPPPLVELAAGGTGTFAGFRLLHGLGQGSSGMVFLAIDERQGGSGAEVALKILNPLLSAAPERRDSILREAEIAAQLDHEGIVKVVASGIERGYAWIATERVDGQRLDSFSAQNRTPAERASLALDLGLQLASALAHSHAHGVVHRDLKPANVLVSNQGRVKVLDFGLARSDGTAFALSSTGEMVGTPLYMAPEQVRGQGVGSWSDVWALGLLLLELARGRPLTAPSNIDGLMRAIGRGSLRPSRHELRTLPESLRAVISRCLEVHPQDRYPSAEALLEDLRAARVNASLPHGALTLWSRSWRRVERHPIRVAWLTGMSIATAALSVWAWQARPMPVYFDTQLTGKVLWVDGVQRGIVPQVLALRPGIHHWRAQFINATDVFEGAFEVRSGEPLFHHVILQPALGSAKSPVLDNPSGERLAWIQVATPEDRVRLLVDGQAYEDQPGITAFRLPLGRHVIRMEKAGHRPYERVIDLVDQHLCFLAHEFDPVDSPWHTVIVYGPFDDIVRKGLVELSGLRLFYEEKNHPNQQNVYRNYAYFGPTAPEEPGVVETRFELPLELTDLEISAANNSVCGAPDSQVLIDIRADGRPWTRLVDWNGSEAPAGGVGVDRLHFDSDTSTRIGPTAVRRSAIVESVQGARSLSLRWTLSSPYTGGDSCAYVCAIRPHPLPSRAPDGGLQWGPAVRIRVR